MSTTPNTRRNIRVAGQMSNGRAVRLAGIASTGTAGIVPDPTEVAAVFGADAVAPIASQAPAQKPATFGTARNLGAETPAQRAEAKARALMPFTEFPRTSLLQVVLVSPDSGRRHTVLIEPATGGAHDCTCECRGRRPCWHKAAAEMRWAEWSRNKREGRMLGYIATEGPVHDPLRVLRVGYVLPSADLVPAADDWFSFIGQSLAEVMEWCDERRVDRVVSLESGRVTMVAEVQEVQ